ncbi:hypothetical protein [Photobacterium nomapromontoriensis]|uniref:hypothetical protein n=1 Tax=Photobacterium nomapromontoriensis TaxID=2910237 RepID=UPI003D14D0E1
MTMNRSVIAKSNGGKRYIINTLIALLMVVTLILLLRWQDTPQPKSSVMQVRSVNTAALSIPKSPPQSQRSQSHAPVPTLNIPSQHSEVQLVMTPLTVSLMQPQLVMPEWEPVNVTQQDPGMSDQQLLDEIQTYSLSQLDAYPKLLNRITAKLPAEIVALGVREHRVLMHVIIHESGRVELVNVDSQEYPQLQLLAEEIVKQAHFSAPLYQGKKVKAEFKWPVKVKA